MKTMKKMTGGLMVLATMMATGAADLTAQQGRRGAQMGADRGQRGGVERIMQMRERLELTDNQLAQLDALRSTSVARRTAAMAQMSELQSQLAAGQIERSDFMAAMEGRRDETEGVAEAHRTQIESLLTDAQRETLEQAGQRGRAFRAGVAAGMRRGGQGQGMSRQRGVRGQQGMRGQNRQRPAMQGRRGPGGQGAGAHRGQGVRDQRSGRAPGGARMQRRRGGGAGSGSVAADTTNIGFM